MCQYSFRGPTVHIWFSSSVIHCAVWELTMGLDKFKSTRDCLILIQFVGSLEEVTEEGPLIHVAVSNRVIL